MFTRRLFIAAVAAALTTTAVHAQQADDASAVAALKSAPFRVVAPFPPGGPIDVLARIFATGLQNKYGQSAVVENKPGAAGNIGIDIVKRAAGDGHTLLVVPAGNMTINPTLLKDLPYNVEADFLPIGMIAKAPNVIAVNPSVPVKSIADLVAYSKANKGTVSYGSPGVGSGLHLAGELFKQASGADILHVPYKGTTQALNDVLGGQIQVIFANLPTLMPHIKSGKLRALAVTDATRTPLMPDLPTLGETGIKGVEVTSWYGLFAPKATPPAIAAQLARDVTAIMNEPATLDTLTAQALTVSPLRLNDFSQAMRVETATWAKVIKERNITAE
ncbi:Bug family tripartite tricarboxylate transporter substrate binding protein [Pigmentiphaga litoralis]|uniref:Bug family tripartite tricarboxylate transporter substrate binding protein n=1 Tax=Pigmentiphaga litoralis TaxID=516702 RepID=UPI003B4341FF